MNFEPILYGPLFIRDAQDINLVAASADPVDLTVSVGGSSWTIPVSPVLTNNRYLAALRMREILSSVVGIPGLANAGELEVPIVTLSAGDATMSVRAVYGAASGKTPTQLAGHWLSWRDQVSMTHVWGRERLTFLAGLDLLGWQSGTYSVKAKIFLTSGVPVTVTLSSGTLQSGCRYVTVDASYATIAAAVSASVRSKIRAWDVSYSFSGTDSQSSAATINGYPLRLIIARNEVRVKEFVFCNSFGVEERVYSSGRSNSKLDGSSVAFLSGATEYELRNDSTEVREVYSGRLGSARESALWLDFLKAHDRYILTSGGLARIIVDSQETDLQDNALGSVKFTYHLGAPDNGRYFNDQEGLGDYDPTQRHGALYIGDEPPSEELPSEDLFFLKTRLDEFPVADLSEEYLFLVQDPLTLEWCNAPLSDIKEWLQQVIIHEDVHVWSGPWEQYSAAFAGYALSASLGMDLLDRVVALERDLPIGLVQSVAGVVPDEDGNVDADELKSALGLKSAAYRDEEYFARASHTHEISDINGLSDGLSTISSALQSLQAQIDSVASRDSFDELTASSAFIDMLAADDIYANRYHFTPDIFFSFELTDGVPAVRLNAALITAGDQVLGDGTPGGGEPTGISYLHELLDVNISGPADGQILTYNGTQQKWINAAAPEDSVQSVAGVGPDESGDVDVDELKSALGLKSAAYRDEEYFARASHTHEISDINGLSDGLSTISSALQSLQAQIDSVASRDSFDELTASSAFIDMLAADDIYANRYHFTPDIFFSFELTDGVPAVRLNAALITAGDQVLGDGTPGGGGGGGGASYLYELLDVDDDLSAPVVGTLLQWYGGEWVGTTFSNIANGDLLTYAAGKWSNVPRTSVGVVTDATSSEHGLMSAADKSKLDSINTTHISHGETAYNALDVIGPALQSLQAQIDSVASRDSFDELTASSAFIDMLAADDIYGTVHGALDGNAATATNADKLDGFHAADLFSALGSGAAANLSLTVGGITRTATLYATYDSASENISDKFGIVGGALQGLQAQVDAVASRVDISDFEASTEAKMDYMCDLMRSLQSQIDSVSTRINDGSDAYYDILSVGKAIYGDVLITTGEQTLSDERFKTITREIDLTAEEIASCRAVAFNWKHKPGSSFGSIAQDWQKILPEAVSDSGDELYLSYSQSAEVAVINLAREVVRLKKMLGINK